MRLGGEHQHAFNPYLEPPLHLRQPRSLEIGEKTVEDRRILLAFDATQELEAFSRGRVGNGHSKLWILLQIF